MSEAAKKPVKETRLNLRVSQHQKEVLARAAKMRDISMSQFMLEKAYEAAQQVLAEQNYFSLEEPQWIAFCEALDESPQTIPALKRLLMEPSILDTP